MRLACFSDIHANFPALARALHEARRRGAERLLAAGDLIGSGPHPVEVLRLLQETGVEAVRGNIERKVLARLDEPQKARKARKKGGRAAVNAWTASQLGPAEIEFLCSLPERRELHLAGVDVLLVHGSPLADDDYVYPSLTVPALRAKLGPARPGLLVCGHSHIPFARRLGEVRVVNCGSVGRPIDGDPRGSFALVDLEAGRVRAARIVRFAFSLDPLAGDLAARGLPADDFEFLLRAAAISPKSHP